MTKSRSKLACVIIAMAFAMFMSAGPASAQKRIALIFGNSTYQNAPQLPNPARDATAIAQMFKDAGFDAVDLQLNLGGLDFKRAIRKFESAAEQADIAVIYFAGHGIEIGGTNYLIPVDARLASDRDADDEAVPLERLVSSAEGARRLRLIILDACRDNPFVGSMKRERKGGSRGIFAGLGRVEPTSKDTLVAYAAKAGSTAEDGEGEHSPFANAILKELPIPGLDVRLAFGRVRDDVLKATSNRQEPFVYGSLGGGNVSLVPAPSARQEASGDGLRADFELVRSIGTKRAWQVFLGTHPTGFYADLARAQIDALTKQEQESRMAALPQPPPSEPNASADALAWDEVKDSSDPAALQKFISRFPDSPLALSAQQRIDRLNAEAADRAAAQPNSFPLIRAAQTELIRLGCFNGKPDGALASTQTALKRYLTIVGLPVDNLAVTQDVLAELTKNKTQVCPLECESGEILKGGSCVAETKPTEAPSPKGHTQEREQARQDKPAREKQKPRASQQARARPSVVGGGASMTGVGF